MGAPKEILGVNLKTIYNVLILLYKGLYGPCRNKTGLQEYANNKGTDQPAHTSSQISGFIIHFLESTISNLTTSEISIF